MRLLAHSLLLIVAATALQANAAGKANTAAPAMSTPSYSSSSSGEQGKHVISPLLGFMGPGANVMNDTVSGVQATTSMKLSGLFGIGCDYDYMLKDDFGVGGMFRYYQTDDSISESVGNQNINVSVKETAFVLGPTARAYLINSDHFRGYFGTGLVLLKLTQKLSPDTGASQTFSPDITVGLPFAIGFGYKLTDMFTLGIEHLQVMALGSNINGWPVSDFMVKFSIGIK